MISIIWAFVALIVGCFIGWLMCALCFVSHDAEEMAKQWDIKKRK